jgi:hypothetical protein
MNSEMSRSTLVFKISEDSFLSSNLVFFLFNPLILGLLGIEFYNLYRFIFYGVITVL